MTSKLMMAKRIIQIFFSYDSVELDSNALDSDSDENQSETSESDTEMPELKI